MSESHLRFPPVSPGSPFPGCVGEAVETDGARSETYAMYDSSGWEDPAEFSEMLSEWDLITTCHYPIGSMYGIYANIWCILMVNVTIYIYIAYMDPMGIVSWLSWIINKKTSLLSMLYETLVYISIYSIIQFDRVYEP